MCQKVEKLISNVILEVCTLNCGQNGECQDGKCICQSGWEGPFCDVRTCDHRCFLHGQCKNGSCVCARGWNGKHCTIGK